MLIIALILTCLMFTVILTDSLRYIIPNWLVLAVILLYPVTVYISPARPDWKMALLVSVATFAVGFIIFILKVMGGGDVKLLAATALYAGASSYLDFIVGVALLGGALALFLIIIRPLVAMTLSRLKTPPEIPRVLTTGEPAPYGVAIAAMFIYLLWMGMLPGIVL